MLQGLLDAVVERIADILEKVGSEPGTACTRYTTCSLRPRITG